MTMAFFLIGRGPENDVHTLSDSVFATRQEAMAELSRLSADPAFDDWDAEVFVLDLDDGVPVLLVRPKEAGAEQPAAASTGDADAWVADLQPQADVPVESTEPAQSATEESSAAEAQEPVDETDAAPPEPPMEPTPPPVAPTAADVDETDLRGAILRTTQHMTAEGIAPPASAGFAAREEPRPGAEESGFVEPEPEPQDSPAAVPEPIDAGPVVAEEAPAPEPVELSPAVTEEAPVSEAIEAALPPAAQDLAPPVPTQDDEAPAAAWPWDSLDVEPVAEQAEPLEDTKAHEAPEESQEDAVESASASESDFILDLDAIQPVALESEEADEQAGQPVADTAPQEPEPPAPTPVAEAATSMADYTCEDCVYVETCPNQGQRLPKDCGSFQWR
jgi:hypothetical protein